MDPKLELRLSQLPPLLKMLEIGAERSEATCSLGRVWIVFGCERRRGARKRRAAARGSKRWPIFRDLPIMAAFMEGFGGIFGGRISERGMETLEPWIVEGMRKF